MEEDAIVYRSSKESQLPKKGTLGSAGYDICGLVYCSILPFKTVAIPTGLSILPPAGTYIRMTSRSSVALNQGLIIAAEVIDPDFTGNFKIIIYNGSTSAVTIHKGQKLAQIVFECFSSPLIKESEQPLPTTERGSKGIGSTSKYHK